MSENIILIGFMGAGKTSVGKRYANEYQIPFLDTDEYIEEMAGKKVSQIFKDSGEEEFRRMETEAVRSLFQKEGSHVISVGGGLPMREENRKLLKKLGTVVYLKVSADTVEKRLKGDTTRPLLMKENPRAEIERLLALRGPVYEDASHLIIETDDKDTEVIIEEIGRKVHQAKRGDSK